jgi:hypothetical protein
MYNCMKADFDGTLQYGVNKKQLFGAPVGIRTPNLLIRRLALHLSGTI